MLLDTSFLVALFSSRDRFHARAIELRDLHCNEAMLLPEYVVVELATVLALKGSMQISKTALSALMDSKEIEFVPCSDFFAATMEVFKRQEQYSLSFVDSAIVAIAESRLDVSLLSFDEGLCKVLGDRVVR